MRSQPLPLAKSTTGFTFGWFPSIFSINRRETCQVSQWILSIDVMGLRLTDSEIATLETRTEG